MWISEQLLYLAAKALYRTEIALSAEMKQSRASREAYAVYRSRLVDETIIPACRRFDVPISGKTVLDLGCNDGAISEGYLAHSAVKVTGVDVRESAIEFAKQRSDPRLEFHVGTATTIPLPDESVDTIVSHDVFEHVTHPAEILAECRRILRPGGKVLIGTWGWKHPYAPHLWLVMPVPWAHCIVSERTLLRVCRRVYNSPWYVPTMQDVDEHGNRYPDKYSQESISTQHVNKLLIRDFERVFEESGFKWKIHPQSFSSRYVRWAKVFLRVPWIREYVTSYFWAVLTKAPRCR